MIYIKSILVGTVTLVVATLAYTISAAYLALRNLTPPPGVEVSFMVGSIFYRLSYWIIAVAAFVLGFYWRVRRVIE